VEEALSRDAGIAGHGTFRVKCEEGIVTLSGSAETLSVLRQAERRAGDILGVLDVVIVCNISTAGAPDSQILLAIQRALDLPAFRGDNIAVAVIDGHVHLSGTTATYARKLLAERSASEVPGAVAVRNNLRVAAPPEGDDAALAWRIRLLLTGGLTPIPGRFDVTVKGREVVLRGEVPLYSHRIQAERLALSVGGIVAVENRLKVDPSLASPRIIPEGTP
jgi:osmotically-inducible protein OsmY